MKEKGWKKRAGNILGFSLAGCLGDGGGWRGGLNDSDI